MMDFNLDQLVMSYGGASARDSPRISQDDDFQQHFLPGCHSSSSAAGRQTAFSRALAGNPDTLTAALISSTQVATRQTVRRSWRTMQATQSQKIHLNKERSLWKSLACKCVSSSLAWANQVWIPFIPVMCSLGCWANHEDHITLPPPSTEHERLEYRLDLFKSRPKGAEFSTKAHKSLRADWERWGGSRNSAHLAFRKRIWADFRA